MALAEELVHYKAYRHLKVPNTHLPSKTNILNRELDEIRKMYNCYLKKWKKNSLSLVS